MVIINNNGDKQLNNNNYNNNNCSTNNNYTTTTTTTNNNRYTFYHYCMCPYQIRPLYIADSSCINPKTIHNHEYQENGTSTIQEVAANEGV